MKPKKNLNSFYWLNNLLNVSALKKKLENMRKCKIKSKVLREKSK